VLLFLAFLNEQRGRPSHRHQKARRLDALKPNQSSTLQPTLTQGNSTREKTALEAFEVSMGKIVNTLRNRVASAENWRSTTSHAGLDDAPSGRNAAALGGFAVSHLS
jgi:hypothetical protein